MRLQLLTALICALTLVTPAFAGSTTTPTATGKYEAVKKQYGTHVGFKTRQKAYRDSVMAARRQGVQSPAAQMQDIMPAAGGKPTKAK